MPEAEALAADPAVTEMSLAQDAAGRILASEEPEKPAPVEPALEQPAEPAVEGDTPPVEQAKQEGETPEVRKYKVPWRDDTGQEAELEVDEPELIKGYIRQKAYQQKTSELAREKQGLQEQVKKQVDPVVQQYQQNLQVFERAVWQALAPEIQGTDWNKLAVENPSEWAAKSQRVANARALIDTARQEQAKIANQQQADSHAKQLEAVKQANETLRTEIPGWNNELYGKILTNTTEYGFSQEELNAITDPRVIKALNHARLYSELQKSRPLVEKKVAAVEKVIKPRAAENAPQGRETWTKDMARLRQTGKDEDAIALAKQILG